MTTGILLKQCGESICNEVKSLFFEKDKMEKAFRIVEKISAVALGAFAAFTSFWLFLPSFMVGAIIGAYSSQKSSHHHHHGEGACSHGFIEQVTGLKLPESLALLAGFAVTAVHIDHHAFVFVPIVGVALGIWAGNLAAPTLSRGMRQFAEFVS